MSTATLRRWSDAGRLRVFTTPGGHRRFSRTALERLLPADRSRRPSLTGAGLTPSRIARTYRRTSREVATELPWLVTITDQQRSLFRDWGQILAAGLLEYVDARDADAATYHLDEASASATEQGRAAAVLGLSLSQTVEAFLHFRAPFLHELAIAARRRGFDAGETTELLETAERGTDRLLLATMTGHGGASVRSTRRHCAAGPPPASRRALQ